ncbi:hypothetical protein AMTR_s00097p00092710 [Amborella trichopoda]|uniref:Uncharacterized protein n=1 Tax=Amborella trichopoda TaxID=13333 RepID=W1P2E8_AMBTC|nr:hypothetical protein AMTR_s00097p00092710 [Amborella trichopoda]
MRMMLLMQHATFEAGLMKDLKSHHQEVVSRLRRDVEHYRSTSNFYQGEAEHANEALISMKRKFTRAMELIHLRELIMT